MDTKEKDERQGLGRQGRVENRRRQEGMMVEVLSEGVEVSCNC